MNLIDRIKEFRLAAAVRDGEYPGLRVSRTYVEEMDWQEGQSINFRYLEDLERDHVAKQRAQDHAAKSYALLKKIANNTHRDINGRVILPEGLLGEVQSHINMLEAI